MDDRQTETVDIHSLQLKGEVWELRCYQSPAILQFGSDRTEILALLQEALKRERPVCLTWNSKTGLVESCVDEF